MLLAKTLSNILREVHIMSEKGFFGGAFDDDTILWFIILFLLLFWCWYGPGYDCGAKG